jgi:NIPSNAP
MEEHPVIHELRIYTCLPGRLPALQQRFETATLAIWERLGIRPLGFWTTMIGPSNNDLTYLIEWQSLAEREQKWATFMADSEWQQAKEASEADGPIVANIASSFLQPTRFFCGFSKPSD